MKTLLRSVCCIIGLLSCISTHAQQIIEARFDLSTHPKKIRIRGMMPPLTLSNVTRTALGDAHNTQEIKLFFKGCPLTNNRVGFDTTLPFIASYPFAACIYTYWDTSSACVFPISTMLTDSLCMDSIQVLDIPEMEQQEEASLELFPIPAKDILQVKNNPSDILIEKYIIMDRTGKTVKSSLYYKNINLEGLPAALYFIRLFTNKGIIHKKLIVQ